MQGLDLCEAFYREHGAPMLEREFPALLPLLAVGLVGSGSECFGYDDAISRDHDFEAGFCLFLPGEELVDRRTAFLLERTYDRLPREFMGVRRAPIPPVGGHRHGVIRIADFLEEKTGTSDGSLPTAAWLTLPEQALAEATGGRLFYDGLGLLTERRRALSYLPEGIRRKKIAGELFLLGQAGQYNYPRSLARGDSGAAQLAVVEFARAAMHLLFLLARRYMPYYKWHFRALSELGRYAEGAAPLEFLLTSPNTEEVAARKQKTIATLTSFLYEALRREGLSHYTGEEAEGHAHAVNDGIAEAELRNLHLLAGV